MEICDCYHEQKETRINDYGNYETILVSHCLGTKECDVCNCHGNKKFCNFYKKETKMDTITMMNEAEKTGKTYYVSDMFYSYKYGFHGKDGLEWPGKAFETINELLNIEDWKEVPPTIMTKEEAENKFNIKIVE